MSVKQNKEKKIKTKCVWTPSNFSVKNNYFYRFEETDTYSGTCRAGKGNFTV